MSTTRSLTIAAVLVTGLVSSEPGRGEVPEPRLLWRVTMSGTATTSYVAVAPNGTVYANNNDRLIAVDPGGNVLWEVPNTSQRFARPISVGADGTIYAGGLGFGQVTALDPDGGLRWAYTPDTGSGLLAGPNLGPDGNLYAIADYFGTYSLDGDGNLRWIGEYEFASHLNNSPILFDTERFFAAISHSGGFPSLHVYGRADGQLIWGSFTIGIPWSGYPVLDAAGRVVGRRWPTWVQALDPATGQEQWFSQHPGNPVGLSWPGVGPDGVVYAGDISGVELWAVNPDGSTRWVLPETPGSMMKVRVAPDNSTIVTTGQNGVGYLRGYDPADGALLWHLDLETENGMTQHLSGFEVVFSADGRTAYAATGFAGAVNDYGYLYAISLDPEGIFSDGFESGDSSAWSSTQP